MLTIFEQLKHSYLPNLYESLFSALGRALAECWKEGELKHRDFHE